MKKTIAVLSCFVLLAFAVPAHATTPTVSIQSISPGTTINVGTTVTFSVTSSGLTNPTYVLNDTFIDGSLGNIDLNSAGNFSWTPENNDVGTHTVTVTATGNTGTQATAVVTFTVNNNNTALSIQSPSPSSTIDAGEPITFNTVATGFTGTPSYSVSDSFTNSSVSDVDISSTGSFSWTPIESDAGQHQITVTATDSSGHSSSNSIGITVLPTTTTTTTTSSVGSGCATGAAFNSDTGAACPAVSSVSGCTAGAAFSATTGAACTAVSTPVVTTTDSTNTSVPLTTAASIAPAFTEQLSLGATSTQVTELQQLLTSEGDYIAPVTGYFGSLTKAAVIKFQAAHKIPQLGIVGPDTRTALNAILSSGTVTGITTTSSSSADSATASSANSSVITEIKAQIQSLQTELTQLESELATIS
jgi:hypothetical protein